VGDDQIHDPWLDESLTQFTTALYFRDRYGAAGMRGYVEQALQHGYDEVKGTSEDKRADLPVAAYDEGQYGVIVYEKAPLFFNAIYNEIGDEKFNQLLQDYFKQYRYGVAYPQDFLKVAENYVSKDKLDEFLKEWITTPSGTPTPTQYPSIPIPPGVFYQGIQQDLAEINFYADSTTEPAKSVAASYADLLKQQGWETCTGEQCNFVNVTDTRFLGTYQFGQGPRAPLVTIGINMMIKAGEQISLFLKNCGKITETKDASSRSSEGCLVLLPPNLATPAP
jgi:hypothetical protein